MACQNESETTTYQAHTSPKNTPIVILVFQDGTIKLDGEMVKFDDLSELLTKKLQTAKEQGVQPLPEVEVQTRGDVLMGTRGAIRDAIQEAKAAVK